MRLGSATDHSLPFNVSPHIRQRLHNRVELSVARTELGPTPQRGLNISGSCHIWNIQSHEVFVSCQGAAPFGH